MADANLQNNGLNKFKTSIHPFAQTSRSNYNKMYAKITEEDNESYEDKQEITPNEAILKGNICRTSLELSSPVPKM